MELPRLNKSSKEQVLSWYVTVNSFLWKFYYYVVAWNWGTLTKADANASNISSNIVNFRWWTKCWMHLKAYKIYKRKKKEDQNCVGRCWIKFVLFQTFSSTFSGSSNQIFMLDAFEYRFIQPLHWVQNRCGVVCFDRFYWHSNVNILWFATKNQKRRRSQTRQERRSKNSE